MIQWSKLKQFNVTMNFLQIIYLGSLFYLFLREGKKNVFSYKLHLHNPLLRLRSLLSTVLRDSLSLHYNFRLVLRMHYKQTPLAVWKQSFNEEPVIGLYSPVLYV